MRLLDEAIGHRARGVLCALAVVLGPSVGAATPAPDTAALCDRHIARTECEAALPPGLLRAVALAESGRWLPEQRASRPWPWTVTSGSESFQLPSAPAALATVRRLRAEGRRNIDVGCMQINLHYHGDAFAGPEEALDPAANVAYAALFLKRLRAETRSWGLAVARYHTGDAPRGRAYRDRVYRFWRDERRHHARRDVAAAERWQRGAGGGRAPWVRAVPGGRCAGPAAPVT